MAKELPYQYSLRYAVKYGEKDEWRESHKKNCECARAIEQVINENYGDNRLGECATAVINCYGFDRVNFVLANTVKRLNEDGRVSEQNKSWAKGIFVSMPSTSYTSNGETRHSETFHPITAEAREDLNNAVLKAYKQNLKINRPKHKRNPKECCRICREVCCNSNNYLDFDENFGMLILKDVGIKLDEQQNKWYCCICVSTENYGG